MESRGGGPLGGPPFIGDLPSHWGGDMENEELNLLKELERRVAELRGFL